MQKISGVTAYISTSNERASVKNPAKSGLLRVDKSATIRFLHH